MRSRGRRPFICGVVPCAPGPDGCGSPAGQPCRSYRDSWHGPATGRPVAEVHAARWRAFRAWLEAAAARREHDDVEQ